MLLGSGSKRSWWDWELASSFVWEVTGKLRENTSRFWVLTGRTWKAEEGRREKGGGDGKGLGKGT